MSVYPQDYLCGADGGERQYLYFCTSKASKLSTSGEDGDNSPGIECISICTFVPVKQVNLSTSGEDGNNSPAHCSAD